MIEYVAILMLFQILLALLIGLLEKKKYGVFPVERMAVIALVPGFGFAIPYFGRLFKDSGGDNLTDIFDHSGQEISNDIRYEKRIEFDKETNLVPVEEALIMNNSIVKRKLIMDTAKEDAYDYISFLKVAMADQDMETSHYAASIVMEINRKLQNVIQEASVAYEHNKHETRNLENYTEIVGKYYHSGLLDDANERRYGYLYSKLLGELLQHKHYNEHLYTEKIVTDIRLMNYPEVFPYLEMYENRYPESETPYLLKMRYHYLTGNPDGIRSVLNKIDAVHVNLSRKGQEIIKFWSETEV